MAKMNYTRRVIKIGSRGRRTFAEIFVDAERVVPRANPAVWSRRIRGMRDSERSNFCARER